MENLDQRKIALVTLMLDQLELLAGVAMGTRLFDACVEEWLVNPKRIGEFRFGHTSTELASTDVAVFCPADIGAWGFRTEKARDG